MEPSQLKEYDEWLTEHMEELVDKYPGKVVAIQSNRIILIGEVEAEIYRQVLELDLKPTPLIFRIPREEDLQSIL